MQCEAGGQADAWPEQQPEGQQPPSDGGRGGGWQQALASSDKAAIRLIGAVLSIPLALLRWLLLTVGGWLRSDLDALAVLVARSASGIRELWPQLHKPDLRWTLRRTVRVLLVVAALLVYVTLVDSVCRLIPRFIEWTHAHPGWLGRAWASAVATAADPQALQQAAAGAASSAAAALGAHATWLQAAAAGAAAALRRLLTGGAGVQ